MHIFLPIAVSDRFRHMLGSILAYCSKWERRTIDVVVSMIDFTDIYPGRSVRRAQIKVQGMEDEIRTLNLIGRMALLRHTHIWNG